MKLIILMANKTLRVLVMGVAGGGLVEREELAQLPQGEVALHVLLLVHHTAAQSLLVGLPLQDLLLDGSRLSGTQKSTHNITASIVYFFVILYICFMFNSNKY